MREEQSFRELEQTQSILTQTVMKRHTLSGSPAEMKRLELQILELQEKLERLVSSQAVMAFCQYVDLILSRPLNVALLVLHERKYSSPPTGLKIVSISL